MSRKDYIALAAAIRDVRELVTSPVAVSVLERVTKNVGDVLATDNPRFDRDRFERATTQER